MVIIGREGTVANFQGERFWFFQRESIYQFLRLKIFNLWMLCKGDSRLAHETDCNFFKHHILIQIGCDSAETHQDFVKDLENLLKLNWNYLNFSLPYAYTFCYTVRWKVLYDFTRISHLLHQHIIRCCLLFAWKVSGTVGNYTVVDFKATRMAPLFLLIESIFISRNRRMNFSSTLFHQSCRWSVWASSSLTLRKRPIDKAKSYIVSVPSVSRHLDKSVDYTTVGHKRHCNQVTEYAEQFEVQHTLSLD